MTPTQSSITNFTIPYTRRSTVRRILVQNNGEDMFLDEKDSSGVVVLMISFITMVFIILLSIAFILFRI